MTNKIEAQSNVKQPDRRPSIRLDQTDIKQLSLLRRFGGLDTFADPRKGLTIPNHTIDGDLRALLDDLGAAGRVRVNNETPKHVLAPSKAGNTVVRPQFHDETVVAAFADVSLNALKPILELAGGLGKDLKAVDIFPNYSSRWLKGVSIELNPGADKWWRQLSDYHWPLGRGLITVALPMGAEEFIDRSGQILPMVEGIGKTSEGMVKYVRFFYSETDQKVFMVVSSGPSFAERHDIAQQLKNIHKPGKAKELTRRIEMVLAARRRGVVEFINNQMGSTECPEEVSDVAYVNLDIDRGLAISGGVGPGSQVRPFSKREDGLIIYHDATDEVHPLGFNRVETKKPIPKFIQRDKVDSWLQGLTNTTELKDLVAGYHSE